MRVGGLRCMYEWIDGYDEFLNSIIDTFLWFFNSYGNGNLSNIPNEQLPDAGKLFGITMSFY